MDVNYIINIRHQIKDLLREEYLFNPEVRRILKATEELLKTCEYIEAIDNYNDERYKNETTMENDILYRLVY